MKRREFIKTGILGAAALGAAPSLKAWIPSHNWDKYDFGSGPEVKDRLYQGPFPQYEPEAFFGGSVVQQTTPGRQLINCFGMGLTSYISGDLGAPVANGKAPVGSLNVPTNVSGKSLEQAIDELFRFPLATKVYIRPNWKHVQKHQGRLDFDDYWKITMEKAEKYGKRIGFRIMMNNPDILENALPDFILDKVPMHKLKGQWNGDKSSPRYQHEHLQPEYQNEWFQKYFEELHAMLAEELNGSPLIEYMDTCMYGFWGEGHTWPYDGNAFPDLQTAEQTFNRMLDVQLKYWDRVPLVTNTQPDFSRVGNSELLDRSIRTNNWLRTDTIFIENEQIEALSNRPAWTAAVCECGISDGREETMEYDDAGLPRNEAIISHVKDVGANYFSLWNWHNINPDNLYRYYEKYPDGLNDLASSIGYRIRPSWIWQSTSEDGRDTLIFGMKNDGIACVPGVLRLTLMTEEGRTLVSGCLDPGYPKTRGVRQCMMILPKDVRWDSGLRLKAEIEVKGARYPVPFAIAQKLNPDGSLTIKRNLRD